MTKEKLVFVEDLEKYQSSMNKNKLDENGYEVNDPRPLKIHIPGDQPLKSIKHISDFSAFMMQKKLDEYMSGPQETIQDTYDFKPVNTIDHELSEKQEESMYQLAYAYGAEAQELSEGEEEEQFQNGVEGENPPTDRSDEEPEDFSAAVPEGDESEIQT